MVRVASVMALLAGSLLFVRSAGHSAATDALVFHDVATMPSIQRGPAGGTTLKAIVTDAGSLFTGELTAPYRQSPHHHDQEQITMSLAGEFQFAIGGGQHRIAAYHAGLPPADVEHFMINESATRATILEYQPIARRDWLTAYPNVAPVPQGPGPVAHVSTEHVTADLSSSSSDWHVDMTGARVKAFAGKTIRVRMFDLSADKASVDVTMGQARVRRFLYVFDGRAKIAGGSVQREIGREMCVEIAPTTDPVAVHSIGAKPTMVGVFETLAR